MKQSLTFIFLLLIGLIGCLALAVPLRFFLSYFLQDATLIELIAGIAVRIFIAIVLFYLIRKAALEEFNGIQKKYAFFRVFPFSIFLLLLFFSFYSNRGMLNQNNAFLFILFVLENLFVGIVEEFSMRGLVLPTFIRLLSKKKEALVLSVLCSSVLFALIHYINLFRNPGNYDGISSQVLFAFAIGVILSSIFLLTRNIYISSFAHAFINIALTGKEFIRNLTGEKTNDVHHSMNFLDHVGLVILLSLISLVGFFFIYLVKKEKFLKRLENAKPETLLPAFLK